MQRGKGNKRIKIINSPSSSRPTVGQNFVFFRLATGQTALPREYGLSQLSVRSTLSGCGAFLNTLFSFGWEPSTISSTSFRMEMRASMNRSSSSLLSDSVGSMSQHLGLALLESSHGHCALTKRWAIGPWAGGKSNLGVVLKNRRPSILRSSQTLPGRSGTRALHDPWIP